MSKWKKEIVKQKYHFVKWNKEKIANLWDISEEIPEIQVQFYPENFYRNLLWNARKFINYKEPILDIGCGTGTLLKVLGERSANIFGIDLSEDNCRRLNEKFQSEGEDIVVRQGDIIDIPFKDNYFGTIFCTETFEHLLPEDLPIGLGEIYRVLRGGGYLIATIPYKERIAFVVCPDCHAVFPPYQHMQSFDEEKIERLLRDANLRPVYLKHVPVVPVSKSPYKNMIIKVMRRFTPTLARYVFGGQFLVVGRKEF